MFWRFGESHVLLACSAIIQNQSWHCQWFIILLDIVSKLLCTTIWSSCAVSFESEQTPFPQALSIQICCFAQDSIENMLLCSYVIFLIRPMNDRKADSWLSKVMGAALISNDFANSNDIIPLKISFHIKKGALSLCVTARNLTFDSRTDSG